VLIRGLNLWTDDVVIYYNAQNRRQNRAMNLPCRSIYETINAGYLEKAHDYDKFTNRI